MKNTIILSLAITILLSGCNQSSNKELKDAKENLTEAKRELKLAEQKEEETAKAKEMADWKAFKAEADSTISNMGNDLKKLEIKIETSAKKDEQKLKDDYVKAKSDIQTLKERMDLRNVEFENDIKNFDNKVSEKNQSFKREFKHDLDEFGKAFKDMFKDNVM
ncbi:hypothetical protein MM239_18320 [Belliella sp. DSM 111904]|uniref:Uncharacterized protein n=1 Tax=Belliella filtrata TaxID=2923435 RepID=A0ABS9V4K9_9BACT|nr:hypothetical protein [Belliella filtrata]MCH7411357.1 hypothetical protein [Belliella filtrata]